jgi:beta-lactamase regulating signal transducer with metallopeptidase domain
LTAIHPQIAWLAERFLNGVPEGIAVAVLVWLLLRMLVHSSSRTRFAVWLSALGAIVILPLARGLWSAKAAQDTTSSLVPISEVWGRDILLAWIALTSLALIRVAVGLWNLRRLRRNSVKVDIGSLDPEVQQTLTAFRGPRSVSLALSSRVTVPAVIGFFQPVILLPAWSLEELSPQHLNSVVMHELAHLRRWDDWTNLGQKLVRAVFFFHPAVWWVDHQLSIEREMACDEFVLSSTNNPQAYAECLVALAEKSFLRRTLALAQALVGRIGQTSRRVSKILDPHSGFVPRRWKPAFALMAVISAASAVWLGRTPELVAFQSAEPKPMLAANSVRPAAALSLAEKKIETESASRMISAAFNERGHALKPIPAAAKKHLPGRSSAPAALKAATHQKHAPVPQLIQASNHASSAFAAVETVYVVTEMQSLGPNGSWALCVWRITLVNSPSIPSRDLVNTQRQTVLPPSKT